MTSFFRWLRGLLWAAPVAVAMELPPEPKLTECHRRGKRWVTRVGYWYYVMQDGEEDPIQRFAILSSAIRFLKENPGR